MLSSCQKDAEHREGILTAGPALLCDLHTRPQALTSLSLWNVTKQSGSSTIQSTLALGTSPVCSGHSADDNMSAGHRDLHSNPAQGAARGSIS